MIEGCRGWFEDGLSPPDAVRTATAAYLSEEDSLAQWIEERCVAEKGRWGVGARLWQSWTGWAEVNKELPGSRKAFAEAMAAHGYAKEKRHGVRGYSGIDLTPEEPSDADLD
jgi:putative DNA primase/helicase